MILQEATNYIKSMRDSDSNCEQNMIALRTENLILERNSKYAFNP
jgi:hypothetical protein